jgi:HAE1 family hydrophobic/amphiphilic exporter-1
MTTFALIAGMMPVAIGVGEGGEFYRPMAVAIIGGTITSTLLTLLVIPTFYDSIEISRDRAIAKFRRRAQRYHAAPRSSSRSSRRSSRSWGSGCSIAAS